MTRLTLEFLRAQAVVFFPASEGEAIYIQQRLGAMGIRWVDGARMLENPGVAVRCGLIVDRGKMFVGNEEVAREYIVASVRDLSEHIDAPLAQLEARVKMLEHKLDRVLALLSPQDNLALKLAPKKTEPRP